MEESKSSCRTRGVRQVHPRLASFPQTFKTWGELLGSFTIHRLGFFPFSPCSPTRRASNHGPRERQVRDRSCSLAHCHRTLGR